jgi:thioesterase domain-containing protein
LHPAVVPIQPDGDRRPLFLLPAADGSLASYLDLARALDPAQPVYGIVPAAGEEHAATIEARAAQAIEAIASVRSHGPYRIGGWSSGGLVAYETARQLRARGERVALLALFDAWAVDGSSERSRGAFAPASTWLGVSLDRWLRLSAGERSRIVLDKLKAATGATEEAALLRRMADELGLPPDEFLILLDEMLPAEDPLHAVVAAAVQASGAPAGDRRREARERIAVLQASVAALAAYRLRPYDGALTLFAAGEPAEDPTLGWGALAQGGVEVHRVPGHHYTMLRPPHARELAARLGAALEARREAT